MELTDAIFKRKSIKAFKPDPVPREKVQRIMEAAIWAPSSSNTQSWEFIVVSGETKGKLANMLIESFRNNKPETTEEPNQLFTDDTPQVYKDRMAKLRAATDEIYKKHGINREVYVPEGSFMFYQAPVVILVYIDKRLNSRYVLDLGAAVQNIHLAALNEGLGTCPIAYVLRYERDIRELFNLPDTKRLVVTVALGYPDWDHPANLFRSGREPLDKTVCWTDM